MIPVAFDYHRPRTLEEAVDILRQYGDEAKVLAGGHSLIPALKLRLAAPKVVVDISRLPGLSEVRRSGSGLSIGAGVTHHQLMVDPLIAKLCPLIARTAPEIGDVQVRNLGTLVGSICHADPAADWPAPLLALEAQVVIVGPEGERTLHINEFIEGMLTTRLAGHEIVREVVIPRAYPASCAYKKIRQSASGFAIAGVAVQLEKKNRKCSSIAIGVTGVAQRAFRARLIEKSLQGAELDEKTIAQAARQVTEEVNDFLSDLHASAAYRAALAQVLVQRAVLAALAA
ncbi:MAG: xanthine dehydrogenase family protein subunit M [Planctomycetes bacterium]|nr:xanthine dehydrogenase family protein subunit M [Planctomycetota bacterium]